MLKRSVEHKKIFLEIRIAVREQVKPGKRLTNLYISLKLYHIRHHVLKQHVLKIGLTPVLELLRKQERLVPQWLEVFKHYNYPYYVLQKQL